MPLGFFKSKKEEAAAPVPAEEAPAEERVQGPPATSHIRSPHVTERATFLASRENAYVFKVAKEADKTSVKDEVEKLYGVEVTGVRMVNVPPKKRRVGRRVGTVKGFKKAVVAVKEGQTIDILPR